MAQPGVCVHWSTVSAAQFVGVPVHAAVHEQPGVVHVVESSWVQGVGVPLQLWLPQ